MVECDSEIFSIFHDLLTLTYVSLEHSLVQFIIIYLPGNAEMEK